MEIRIVGLNITESKNVFVQIKDGKEWRQEVMTFKEFEEMLAKDFPEYFKEYNAESGKTAAEYFYNYGETAEMQGKGEAYIFKA